MEIIRYFRVLKLKYLVHAELVLLEYFIERLVRQLQYHNTIEDLLFFSEFIRTHFSLLKISLTDW